MGTLYGFTMVSQESWVNFCDGSPTKLELQHELHGQEAADYAVSEMGLKQHCVYFEEFAGQFGLESCSNHVWSTNSGIDGFGVSTCVLLGKLAPTEELVAIELLLAVRPNTSDDDFDEDNPDCITVESVLIYTASVDGSLTGLALSQQDRQLENTPAG